MPFVTFLVTREAVPPVPKLANKVLTERMCGDLVKPKKGYKEVACGTVRGLRFRVSASGYRCFILTYDVKGQATRKQNRVPIGQWPQISLSEARRRAQAARDSGDPATYLGVTSNEPDVFTFAELAEKYIDLGLIKQKGPEAGQPLRTAKRYEDIIRDVLIPAWGSRPVGSLTKRDATALTDAIMRDKRERRGGPGAARLTHSVYMRVLSWAQGRGDIEHHPFLGMDAPAPRKVRERVLSIDEVAALWQGSFELEGPAGPLYRMLVLTGQRLSEVTRMSWAEVDLEQHLWLIPGARTKNALDHEVPLSTLVMAELKNLKRGQGGDFVFSINGGRSPINGPNKLKRRMDAASGVTDWRNHDLRRTVRSGMAELGVPEIVSERVLNHAERDQVVKAYNVHKYQREKRDALERWAQRVRKIVTPPPDNVTDLRATR